MTTILPGPDVDRPDIDHGTLNFDLMYRREWRSALRLAVGLVDNLLVAQTLVAAAFGDLYRRRDASVSTRQALTTLRINVVRRARRARPDQPVVQPDSSSLTDAQCEEVAILEAEFDLLRSTLRCLPDRAREILVLRCVAGLGDDEIAVVAGLSTTRVRLIAARGLARMRREIGTAL